VLTTFFLFRHDLGPVRMYFAGLIVLWVMNMGLLLGASDGRSGRGGARDPLPCRGFGRPDTCATACTGRSRMFSQRGRASLPVLRAKPIAAIALPIPSLEGLTTVGCCSAILPADVD
jgi:hypothetical protein